jgi:hypothetical protein
MIWKDKGIGKTGQGGLIGMAMVSGMADQAIRMALRDLLASIPENKH